MSSPPPTVPPFDPSFSTLLSSCDHFLTQSFFTFAISAEISPAEVRGSLVALQQLAITFGIMISFWIDYGTNFIGGTGASQLVREFNPK